MLVPGRPAEVLFLGGREPDGSGKYLSAATYNTETDAWSGTTTSVRGVSNRMGHTCTALGQRLFVFGGEELAPPFGKLDSLVELGVAEETGRGLEVTTVSTVSVRAEDEFDGGRWRPQAGGDRGPTVRPPT